MVKYPSIKCKAYHIVAHNAEAVYIFSFVTARIIIGNRKISFLVEIIEIRAVLIRERIYTSILKSSENMMRSTISIAVLSTMLLITIYIIASKNTNKYNNFIHKPSIFNFLHKKQSTKINLFHIILHIISKAKKITRPIAFGRVIL